MWGKGRLCTLLLGEWDPSSSAPRKREVHTLGLWEWGWCAVPRTVDCDGHSVMLLFIWSKHSFFTFHGMTPHYTWAWTDLSVLILAISSSEKKTSFLGKIICAIIKSLIINIYVNSLPSVLDTLNCIFHCVLYLPPYFSKGFGVLLFSAEVSEVIYQVLLNIKQHSLYFC